MNTNCLNCGTEIKIQIFKGTGHCSDLCRKALAKNEGREEEGEVSGSAGD